MDEKLTTCVRKQVQKEVDELYLSSLEQAYSIFADGYDDLVKYLGKLITLNSQQIISLDYLKNNIFDEF